MAVDIEAVEKRVKAGSRSVRISKATRVEEAPSFDRGMEVELSSESNVSDRVLDYDPRLLRVESLRAADSSRPFHEIKIVDPLTEVASLPVLGGRLVLRTRELKGRVGGKERIKVAARFRTPGIAIRPLPEPVDESRRILVHED